MNGLPRPPLDQISGSEDETECSSIFRPVYLSSKGESGVAGRRGGVGGRMGRRGRVGDGCEEREGEKRRVRTCGLVPAPRRWMVVITNITRAGLPTSPCRHNSQPPSQPPTALTPSTSLLLLCRQPRTSLPLLIP